VQKQLGDSLMIKVAKQTDRGFVEIQTVKAAIDHLVVSQDLALSKGKGLYQIEVYSQDELNGQKEMQRITMFYVVYE
jgi:hypothetical protein